MERTKIISQVNILQTYLQKYIQEVELRRQTKSKLALSLNNLQSEINEFSNQLPGSTITILVAESTLDRLVAGVLIAGIRTRAGDFDLNDRDINAAIDGEQRNDDGIPRHFIKEAE